MKNLALAIARLFVDDGSLAATVLLILVAVGFLASTPWIDPVLLGAAFVTAVLAELLVNVARARRNAVSAETGSDPAGSPNGTRRA
jgi:hypothetical protein